MVRVAIGFYVWLWVSVDYCILSRMKLGSWIVYEIEVGQLLQDDMRWNPDFVCIRGKYNNLMREEDEYLGCLPFPDPWQAVRCLQFYLMQVLIKEVTVYSAIKSLVSNCPLSQMFSITGAGTGFQKWIAVWMLFFWSFNDEAFDSSVLCWAWVCLHVGTCINTKSKWNSLQHEGKGHSSPKSHRNSTI